MAISRRKMKITEFILDTEADEDHENCNFNHVRFRLHHEAYDVSCGDMVEDLRVSDVFEPDIGGEVPIEGDIVPVFDIDGYRDGKIDYLIDVSGHNRIAKTWATWCYLKEREI